MAAIEMEPLFSTPMPSFLETPSRTQWPDQNELTEITYEMIVTDHIATKLQELKANTAKRIDKIERLIWGYVIGHDTVRTEDMKQHIEGSGTNILSR